MSMTWRDYDISLPLLVDGWKSVYNENQSRRLGSVCDITQSPATNQGDFSCVLLPVYSRS